MDKKSPDAFRTISEVADWLGVPTHVLRFWESRFSQVKPVKRAGGRRYYRPADMELLGGIRKLLHDDGMTIRGVQRILREEGVKHVAGLSPALDDTSMKDVTPSNVVELRGTKPAEDSEDTRKQAVAETMAEGGSAPKGTEEGEEKATTAPSAPDMAPTAEAPATPAEEAPATTETPGEVAEAPAPEKATATPNIFAETPVDTQATPGAPTPPAAATPPAVTTADSAQDVSLQGGFDFGTPPTDLNREGDAELVEPPVAEAPVSAPQDTPSPTEPAGQAASEALETPNQIDVHTHGADFTPPPEAETPPPAPAAAETPQADLAEDHGGNEYDDPEELPRLGAQDLPTLTLSPPVEAEEDAAPEQAPVAPQDEPAPEAIESPIEEAAALPPLGTQDVAESPSPAPQPPKAPIEAPTAASDEQIAAPAPLPADVPDTTESAPEAPAPSETPAPIASAETAQDDAETPPAPEEDPVEEVAAASPDEAAEPAPVEAPTAPTANVIDISHLPADPAEDDISPVGPSLAARMRRLSAGHPHGSPAQVRALADRMQELAGRMKRDNPRRSVR